MEEMNFSKEVQLEIAKPILKSVIKDALVNMTNGFLKEGGRQNPILSKLTENEIKTISIECIEEIVPELKEILKKPKKFWNK